MSKTCARCEKTVYPIEELKCLDKVRISTEFCEELLFRFDNIDVLEDARLGSHLVLIKRRARVYRWALRGPSGTDLWPGASRFERFC